MKELTIIAVLGAAIAASTANAQVQLGVNVGTAQNYVPNSSYYVTPNSTYFYSRPSYYYYPETYSGSTYYTTPGFGVSVGAPYVGWGPTYSYRPWGNRYYWGGGRRWR